MPNWAIALLVVACVVIVGCFISLRIWKLVNLRCDNEKIQLPELLISKKQFITANQTVLPLVGHLAKAPERIYIGIHDFLGTENTFNHFLTKKNDKSWVGFKIPKGSYTSNSWVATQILYSRNVITALSNARPNAKLSLVLEGYSCGLANRILKNNDAISEIIYLNPISNIHRLRTSALVKFFYGIGFFFSWAILIPFQIDYTTLTNNKKHITALNNKENTLSLKTIWQYKRINKIWPKKQQNITVPQKIIQSTNDPFYSKITLHNWKKIYFTSTDYVEVSEQRHFDLNIKDRDLNINIKNNKGE